MTKYNVTVVIEVRKEIKVEAKSADAAINRAKHKNAQGDAVTKRSSEETHYTARVAGDSE
ncbi:hypothetical protein JCM19037_3678 [Geomicrobium sp. JCM 19037]|uniref:hypothetical protein n=1 Tax=Geomicrobium sp. JCM 19037 TaxID=1460634 RepID=UPI00045F38A2|nr:hypothetical protein [Geomicrobium sp. JCM 19037]GAK05200.1 hypothetical protein JCM19037_3678 [Geomicrobium sp. JCM 19037]